MIKNNLPSVYIAVKSKKLSIEFSDVINKSKYAEVVDTFYTLKECKEKLAIRRPNILLLGLDLPGINWIDFCSELRNDYPALKILLISSYDEYFIFKNSLNDPNLTSGYISVDALPKVIASGIKGVLSGGFFCYDKVIFYRNVSSENKAAPEEYPESINQILREITNTLKDELDNQEKIKKISLIIDAIENYRRILIQDLLGEDMDHTDDNSYDENLALLFENLFVKGLNNWEIATMLNVNIETVRIYRMDFILRISKNSVAFAKKKDGEIIKLNRRERQLLRLIAAGYRNEEITQILGISMNTVHTHRENLSSKLGFNNTMKMILYAIKTGHIKLEEIDDLLEES